MKCPDNLFKKVEGVDVNIHVYIFLYRMQFLYQSKIRVLFEWMVGERDYFTVNTVVFA